MANDSTTSQSEAIDTEAIAAWELLPTVACTGAAVMLIEIMGTRIIAPVFGSSLFVWAALLSVTLAALALGYYWGGIAIDRRPTPRLLALVVLGSGVLLALTTVIGTSVLRLAAGWGPRFGPLSAAFMLFTPSLTSLGMIGPIAVRLSTHSASRSGHQTGSVYAVSTAGSLIGTLLTAFWLIPSFDTRAILLGASCLLLALGAILLVRRGNMEALLAFAIPLLGQSLSSPTLPAGYRVLDRSQSAYGLVEVIEDSRKGLRLLRSDHSIIGAQYVSNRIPAFGFIHLLEMIRFLPSKSRDMLAIGLGTGALPMELRHFGFRTDVVEIDPMVVTFAEKYFGFSTEGRVYVEDARTLLAATSNRYDFVVHDTFTGGSTPEHLLSHEVMQRIHDILQPGGVLALNFVGFHKGPHAEATWAITRTLRAVFPNIKVFREPALPEEVDDPTNLVFFASDRPLSFDIPSNPNARNSNADRVARSFSSWEIHLDVPPGPVITDERNPLTRLQIASAASHFESMMQLVPLDVWLN